MKASWPYFFLLDVFWIMSSYHSHVQVWRWQWIDENDAWRGFRRRKTAERILQLAAFDNMNWPRRAEDKLYPGSPQKDHVVSSVTQVTAPTRAFFGGIPAPLAIGLKCLRSRKQPLTSSYIQDTSRLSRLSRTWECPRSLYWMLLASYTIKHCLDPQTEPESGTRVNSAEYHRTLTTGPATTRIGFRASEGQLKVRRLVAIAVVDSYLNYIVESCVLRAWYMSSNLFSCDICDFDPIFSHLSML